MPEQFYISPIPSQVFNPKCIYNPRKIFLLYTSKILKNKPLPELCSASHYLKPSRNMG